MARIAESGDPHTSWYWKLATPTEDCPNWIARWFLYHKFRYRDGRNRNPVRGDGGKHKYHSSSSKPSHRHKHGDGAEESNGYPDEYYSHQVYYTAGPLTAGVYFHCSSIDLIMIQTQCRPNKLST